LPSTGRLLALDLPSGEGIRVDTGVEVGSEVSPFYDSMIAKIIAHAPTRAEALDRLANALDRTIVAGPRTNLGLLSALCRAPDFRGGRFDTDFIDRNLDALGATPRSADPAAIAAGVAQLIAREQARLGALREPQDQQPSPWDATDGFQLHGQRAVSLSVIADGANVAARLKYGSGGFDVDVDGAKPAPDANVIDGPGGVFVLRGGRQTAVRLKDVEIDVEHLSGDGLVRAPMHGKILAILVNQGAAVAKGQRLAVIEAMKMEHSLLAPIAGTVGEIAAAAGSQVAEGAKIMVLEPTETE
jgi:3-methylcrotonyl-CoA carboxylase alpha subunit